jgi:iron complex transport system substrate-binding protein
VRILRTVLSVLLVVALAACSGSGSGDEETTGRATTEAAARDTFPLTVEHRFGVTTIEEAPTRVATVGLTDHDAVLALGVTPVGTTEWYGGHLFGVWPWARDELGDAEPVLLGDAEAIDEEAVIEADPDVILALYAGLTQEQYDDLSRFAPVVTAPEDFPDYGIPWQDQTRIVGDVLGRPDEAAALIDDTEQLVADAAAEHPELDGATTLVAGALEGLYVYGSDTAGGRVLEDLGLAIPAEVDEMVGPSGYVEVSLERPEILDVDALVLLDGAPDRPPLTVDAYTSLPVHTEGREVAVTTDGPLAGGSYISVLSLPVILDQLVPMLAAAVDGDPATEVPAER